jgi:hypothetical protein
VEVAKKYNVSESWVRRVVQQRRELGKLGPYKFRRRDRHNGSLHQRIIYMVIEEPRITVNELERVLGTTLSIKHLSRVKDELFIKHLISWYGSPTSELVRSPTGNVTAHMTRSLLPWDLKRELDALCTEV